MPTTATPLLLTDPGYLFEAPAGTAIPDMTAVTGSKYTSTWNSPWRSCGATEEGSTFKNEPSIEAIMVAELFYPVAYRTTEQAASLAFAMADWTLKNVNMAFNGGAGQITVVSGSGTTQSTKLTPVTPGNEVRRMLGWESLDATVRLICYQVINAAGIEMAFKRAPDKALIPVEFNLEKPTSTEPFEIYVAGTGRVGV